MSGWLIADQMRRLDDLRREADELARRRLYEQAWCGGPVLAESHLIPCELPHGHDGPCNARQVDLIRHRLGAPRECYRNACPVLDPSATDPGPST